MGLSAIAYPFLFLAIFFQSFVLVTLLSSAARAERRRGPATKLPSVAVIVPCYNEETTIAGTVDSLLALSYPKEKLSLILVNDGSKDGTREAMERFRGNPQVTVIHKENGGKHTALNAGLAVTDAEIVGCMDADSFADPAALMEIVSRFDDPEIAAVTAAMSIHEPKTLLEKMQNAEYTLGIALRHGLSIVNGLHVTPGPFSFYRKSVIDVLGEFRHGHQVEDMEMALRIQRAGHKIGNAPRARVFTKCPREVGGLIKQRTRWTTGFLRNIFGEYRGMVGNRAHGALGLMILPLATLAIASGILLFVFSISKLIQQAIIYYQVRQGIPLSYGLLPDGFDWFYMPVNAIILLAVVCIAVAITLIAVGKRISKSPKNLVWSTLAYLVLYGFIAPLWLIRSVADVTFGRRRAWR